MSQPSTTDSFTHEASSSLPVDDTNELNEVVGLDFHDEDEEENRAPPRRLLRAECILAKRTNRFIVVVETIQDSNNYQAILRTAESFGVQNVWVVDSGIKRKHEGKVRHEDERALLEVAQQAATSSEPTSSSSPPASMQYHEAAGTVSMASGRWLTIRHFNSTRDCIEALRADGREIWVTALSLGCVPFDRSVGPIPDRLAIVLGRELDGVSAEMCAAASKAVFLPMVGFSESFNVSVAAALVMQRLFDLCPEAVGSMGEEERSEIRARWYRNLSLSTPGAEDIYINFWLPRASRTVEWMREAVRRDGEMAVIRPTEEARMPQINPKVRRRMEREGQRSVIVSKSESK